MKFTKIVKNDFDEDVAEFEENMITSGNDGRVLMDKESVEIRINNLKKLDLDTIEEEKALKELIK